MREDTEEAALPPIEHVEAHRHVVEMNLAADPIHPSLPSFPDSIRSPASERAVARETRRDWGRRDDSKSSARAEINSELGEGDGDGEENWRNSISFNKSTSPVRIGGEGKADGNRPVVREEDRIDEKGTFFPRTRDDK